MACCNQCSAAFGQAHDLLLRRRTAPCNRCSGSGSCGERYLQSWFDYGPSRSSTGGSLLPCSTRDCLDSHFPQAGGPVRIVLTPRRSIAWPGQNTREMAATTVAWLCPGQSRSQANAVEEIDSAHAETAAEPCSACNLPRRPISAEAIDDQYEIASMKCLRCDTVVRLSRRSPK